MGDGRPEDGKTGDGRLEGSGIRKEKIEDPIRDHHARSQSVIRDVLIHSGTARFLSICSDIRRVSASGIFFLAFSRPLISRR